MKIVSLFCGAGLMDAGLLAAGNEIVLQCELPSVQQDILRITWPDIPKWDNVMTLSKEVFELYDIDTEKCAFVATPPCQQHSLANPHRKTKGESILLWKLVELCRTCQPRLLLVENVYGFLSDKNGLLWLQERLAAVGYFGCTHSYKAAAFGAPMWRERIFAVFFPYQALFDPARLRWGKEGLPLIQGFPEQDIGYWHGRNIASPGFPELAYWAGGIPQALEKYLEIIGNGVCYDMAFLEGKFLKHFGDYIYND